jgi:putative ABC transport system permease protein
VRRVTPGYFQTVDLALADGRLLLEQDATTAPAVSVINAAAAARFFPGRSPLGAQLQLYGAPRTIVTQRSDARLDRSRRSPALRWAWSV